MQHKFSEELKRVVEELSQLDQDLRELKDRSGQTAQAKARELTRKIHQRETTVGAHFADLKHTLAVTRHGEIEAERSKKHLVEANLRLVVSVAKKYVNGSLKSANILFSGPLRELFFRDLEALLVVLKAGCADEGRARNSSPPESPGR